MVYVVERGDTLRKIADRHGSTVAAFLSANPHLNDPDRIHPGQELMIPGTVPPATPRPGPAAKSPGAAPKEPAPAVEQPSYEVQSGDSMKRIAAGFGVTLRDLIAANPQVSNPDAIRPGQILAIPRERAAPPPAVVTPKEPSVKARDKANERPARAGAVRPVPQDWSLTPVDERTLYVMERLVRYGYPVNGAAGILGNLFVESGVLPNRVQGSSPGAPMRAKNFDGVMTDFTARDVMRRDEGARRGPQLAGVGLAQWTWGPRRAGLFAHAYKGSVLKTAVLFSMDAQIDYLVTELRGPYKRVERVVADPGVALDEAADEVLYEFEVPQSVIGTDGKLPRSDRAVRDVFDLRRAHAQRARALYGDAHGV